MHGCGTRPLPLPLTMVVRGPVDQSCRGNVGPMRMRAAVLEEFGAPLVVQDVELADPRAGEVLVRLVACGVCHTDMYTASGADPSGYAPTVLGHEGAGVVEAVGEGVTSVAPGDHVVTLFSPQCRECIHCLLAEDEPLSRDPRAAGPRLPARRHDAPLARRRADPPLHGHLDVRRVHRDARDRAREGRQGRLARVDLHARLRCDDRRRRRALHREGRARLDLRDLRRRPRRARHGRRLPARGRRADHHGRPLRRAARDGARRRARPTRWSPARTRSRRSSR